MTHEYTLLVGGTILPGFGQPTASAIAWAEDTVLALGTDEQVRAVSRGDSLVVDLRGAFVVPVDAEGGATWPTSSTLEVGGPADLAVLLDDPRVAGDEPHRSMGLVRSGHLVRGRLGPPPGGESP